MTALGTNGHVRRSSRPVAVWLLAVLILGAAGFFATTALSYRANVRRDQVVARSQAHTMAELGAQGLGDDLQQVQDLVANFVAEPSVRTMATAECQPALAALSGLDDDYVAVVGPDGTIRCSSTSGLPVGTRPPAQLLPSRYHPGAAITSVVTMATDPVLKRLAFDVAWPIPGATGNGLMVAGIDMSSTATELAQNAVAHGALVVFATGGRVALVTPATAGAGVQPVGRSLAASSTHTVVGPGRDGIIRIYASATVSGPGWPVYAGIPLAAALSPSRTDLRRAATVNLIAILLLIFLVVLLHRGLVRPLAALDRAIASSTTAPTETPTLVGGPREVAQLAVAFNAMQHTRAVTDAALRESEGNFRLLFADNPQAMWVYDVETLRFIEVNDAAVTAYGWSREEFLGMTVLDLLPPGEANAVLPLPRPVEQYSGERTHCVSDGRLIIAQVTCRPLTFAGRPAVVVLAQDVTQRREAESALEHQALHDPLTKLPNRALLRDRLELALTRSAEDGSSVAVLFLDVDRFKVVNDSLGHSVGDRLLVSVAERLRTALRPADTVARLGGDEFAIVCGDLSGEEEAVIMARRVLDVMAEPFEGELVMSVSIGIVVATGADQDPEALLRDADSAMYRAKENGKDRYELFDEGMRRRAVRRLDTERELRHAIDHGQLRVYYQPEVDVVTGAVRGAEALVRWQHPTKGLILPAQFIPVAEETGLIVPLGLLVLEEACTQAHAWRQSGEHDQPITVAVNLSPRQVAQPDLVESVSRILQRTGVAPSSIFLEITETALMDDTRTVAANLVGLKALGLGLCLDDFGTGYSSLSYLQRVPVDVLKVDRAFVSRLGRTLRDVALVAAVISMAHAVGLVAVAEGVETMEQLDALREMGCDLAQGFLFARPAPADELTLRRPTIPA